MGIRPWRVTLDSFPTGQQRNASADEYSGRGSRAVLPVERRFRADPCRPPLAIPVATPPSDAVDPVYPNRDVMAVGRYVRPSVAQQHIKKTCQGTCRASMV